jgi:peptidoglycan/xylan/chitin deacetylase (PgdA/CDA1 family)
MMIVLAATILALLLLFAVWRIRYRFPPSDVPPVLCYHKLSRRFCLEGTWVTPGRFLDQIDYLEGKGYRFITEEEFLQALDRPAAENGKNLLLTFDDGYRELHDLYVKHLHRRSIHPLVFLITDYMGEENTWDLSLGRRAFRHLAWEEAADMAAGGASFGSHGATHIDLTRIPRGRCEREITDSKAVIEEGIGRPVNSFSYPFGHYNSETKSLVRAAGYKTAFSLYPSHTNERIDRYALRRNGVYIIDTRLSLGWKLNRSKFFWFEEMKCRTINGVAVITPLLKRSAADRDS